MLREAFYRLMGRVNILFAAIAIVVLLAVYVYVGPDVWREHADTIIAWVLSLVA
jgi:hypothetical protein